MKPQLRQYDTGITATSRKGRTNVERFFSLVMILALSIGLSFTFGETGHTVYLQDSHIGADNIESNREADSGEVLSVADPVLTALGIKGRYINRSP